MANKQSARYVFARAVEMRQALEKLCMQPDGSIDERFPAGCAISASLLLGAWFADHGIQGFDLVSGTRPGLSENVEDQWFSHHWLSRGDLIVDITADQYIDAPDVPIVDTDSAWHDTFTPTGLERSDFREIQGASHLEKAYLLLARMIETSTHAA